MKKKYLFSLLMIPFLLSACNSEPGEAIIPDPVVPSYTIKFANDNGIVLKSYTVRKHMIPNYDGEIPTKFSENYLNEYEFIGWDKEIVEATANVTYTAKYELKIRPHDKDLSYAYNDVYFEGHIGNFYSGFMADFAAGRMAAEGTDYVCSTGQKTVGECKSSNNEICEVVKGNTATGFIIKCKKPGNAVVKVYSDEDELVYREMIRVRPRQTVQGVIDILYKSDHYEVHPAYAGMTGLGIFNLTALDNNSTPSCVFEGGDDYDGNIYATFNLEYEGYEAGEFDLYTFRVKNLDTNSRNTVLYEIKLSPVGDMAYVYYNSGFEVKLLTILVNSDVIQYLKD